MTSLKGEKRKYAWVTARCIVYSKRHEVDVGLLVFAITSDDLLTTRKNYYERKKGSKSLSHTHGETVS